MKVKERRLETIQPSQLSILTISTEALKFPFLPLPPIKQELVVSSFEQLEGKRDWGNVSGIHFRTGKRLEEKIFYQQLIEIIKEAGQRSVGYATIHLEDLPSEIDQTREKLNELNQLAKKNGVSLLLENVAPRVDQNLQPWHYSLIEFMKTFGEDLQGWSNIDFCLDIAHLGLAEPKVLEVLGKLFEASLAGDYNLRVLSEEEQKLWFYFYQVLMRAKTIHWSRSRRRSERMFKVFEKLASKISLFQQAYTFLENISLAHYSLISDSNFFTIMAIMLQELGWRGTIVIESPDALEFVREVHFPHRRETGVLEKLTPFRIKNFLRKIFENNGIRNPQDREDLINFCFGDELLRVSPRFFEFLERYFPLIRRYYQDEKGKDFRRKVNGGLYLRHVLRAAVLADINFESLIEAGLLKKKDYPRLILSTFFHDGEELRPDLFEEENLKNLKQKLINNFGLPEPLIDQTFSDIHLLTPQKKPSGLNYFQRKRQDFEPVVKAYNEGNKIPLLVKVFDMLANIEETIDDLRGRRENGQVRPLALRYQVWEERSEIIKSIFGQNLAVVKLLREKLKEIEDLEKNRFLLAFSPEEINLLEEIKNNSCFRYRFNNQEIVYDIDGVVSIVGWGFFLVKRVNRDTVELLSFDDLVKWKIESCPLGQAPSWFMLCRQVNEWTNSPYPPYSNMPIKINIYSKAGQQLESIAEGKKEAKRP